MCHLGSEDNALGKMPESRYETLVRQYSKAQNKNTYAIPAEDFDQEHYLRTSVVPAESAVPNF